MTEETAPYTEEVSRKNYDGYYYIGGGAKPVHLTDAVRRIIMSNIRKELYYIVADSC